MKNFFILEQSPVNKKWLIKINFDKLQEAISTSGSYAVLPARAMSLKYADYLRLCRDKFNATLSGKGERYPIAYFEKEDGEKLLRILNTRMSKIKR